MGSLLKKFGWYEWLCHTNFSFLTGASHPHEYLARALRLGYAGLGVTDFDGVYGLARAHLDLQRLRREEPQTALQLFHGAELHLAFDHDLPVTLRDTLVLVARTRTGYANLCRLATYAHREGKTNAYVPVADLLSHPVDDLVAIQPMRGLIRRAATTGPALEARLAAIAAHFGGRLYLAVSRHLSPSEDRWAMLTIALAERLGLNCVLSQDAFFHAPECKDLSDVLQAIRTNQTLDQAVAQMFVNTERCLHDLPGIERRLRELPIYAAALRTSRELAESCLFQMSELRYQYPKEMIPAGETAQSYLAALVWAAARERYGALLPAKISGLLTHELELIQRLAFADYFLTVWDIVRWARSQDILCQGRGSAANSAVCFVLGVTAVDPTLFDLLFERFVSVERGDPPDIDVDFEHERREEVIQYIYTRYGREQASMVANVITFRSKGALRAVGKSLGVPETMLGQVAGLLAARYFRSGGVQGVLAHARHAEQRAEAPADPSTKVGATGLDLEPGNENWEDSEGPAFYRDPSWKSVLAKDGDPPVTPDGSGKRHEVPWSHLAKSPQSPDAAQEQAAAALAAAVEQAEAATGHKIPWQLWGDLAERLQGFPRHLGIHSGGFMLADQPLWRLVAQEPATMEGRTVIQWSKEDIEGLGFFKIDVLALGMLTAIRKCFTALRDHYGVQLSLASIPQDDAPTYAMIQRADTVGTFQIESRAQMSMLPRLRPRNFYDLVIEVAIIRPGPIQGGMVHPYLRRREGKEPVSFPDDRLRPILARTLGIPLFQEQVMRIAIAVGDFTPGEANELRRHMGAWSVKGDMGPWLTRLASGMRKNGLSDDFIFSILEQMKGFAHYGFPESHAVSFALLAYASCFLKCHFPAAFFQAVLNSQPMGFYAPHALLQAARRDGVKILPACVQHSTWDSSLELVSDVGSVGAASAGVALAAHSSAANTAAPPVYALRLGLRLVTGLSQRGAEIMLRSRTRVGGRFSSWQHCLRETPFYRNDLTALAAAGAFAVFGLERKAAIWLAEAAPFCPVLEDREEPVHFARETAMEKATHDFAATSTTLGPHPATIIREEHWCYAVTPARVVSAKDLATMAPGKVVDVFGMVLVRQSPPSAGGMVFITLEDATGFLNLVFTPDKYAQFFELLEKQAFLCARGRLQRQNEQHSLQVTQVFPPRIQRGDVIPLGKDEVAAKAKPVDNQVDVTTLVLHGSRNYM